MTDQTIPAVTDNERRLAYEWAEDIASDMDTWGDSIRAVARVVLNAVPAPPRPTLADMTNEERAACQWMQADAGQLGRVVIVTPDKTDNLAALLDRQGNVAYGGHDTVTPRPDLPRMEWPGDQKPAPAPVPALPGGWRPADHQKFGRVIVTNSTPNQRGHVCFTRAHDSDPRGFGWDYCTPDVLTYIDAEQEEDPSTAPDHLAVGDVIESADDPRIAALPVGSILSDCDGEATTKRDKVWMGDGYTPIPSEGAEFGPWTVLHIPQEADQ